MAKIFIKGAAQGTRGCCLVCVGDKTHEKVFAGVMPTRSGGIPLDPGKGSYQAELYALAWGLQDVTESDDVVIVTNSVVIKSMINYLFTDHFNPDLVNPAYRDLMSVIREKCGNRKVSIEQADFGKSRVMNRLRERQIEVCEEAGI